MKKHIVIVLGDYYPRPSANGICIEEVSNSFIEYGYSVDIVSNYIEKNVTSVNSEGRTLYFVKLPVMQRITKRIKEVSNPYYKVVLRAVKLALRLTSPIVMLTYPIGSIFRCLSYAVKVKSIIKKYNVVAVIGVHKPMEAILGAFLSAKIAKKPFYGYFLDPLVDGYTYKYIPYGLINNRTLKYEKRLVSFSTKAVFMNSHYNDVIKRYDEDQRKKLVFLGPPLLKDHKAKIKVDQFKEKKVKKVVVYAGSIYQDIRNPKYIMEVFKYVSTAKLMMYVPNPAKWLYENINQNVEILGGLPHQEIIDIMQCSDALLNIGNSTPLFIPSKTIECMSMGKPIISTYSIDNDPCLPYMNKYPYSICLDEKKHCVQDAAKMIDEFLNQEFKEIPFERIRQEFYINTPEAFCEVVYNSI